MLKATHGPPLDVDDAPLPARTQDVFIGSGPGASVVASYLAQAGRDVVLLEEGPCRERRHFADYSPADAFGQMYRSLSGFPVLSGKDTPPLVLIMARTKGGGSVVNGAVCYRADAAVVDAWHSELGLRHLAAELPAAYARVERKIGVTSMHALHSHAALKARDGAKKLGWAHHDVQRNTPGCRGTGRCLSGCPHDAKQSMLLTYLKDAERYGARTFADTLVKRVDGRKHGHVTGVSGVRHGKAFSIAAERVFMGAGAVFSPFILQKSGIRHLRALGRHLTVHPSTRAYYVYDDEVNGWDGAFQSFAIHEFRSEGIHLINLFPPPWAYAMSLPSLGNDLRQLLGSRVKHLGVMGGLVSDHGSEGRVQAMPMLDFPVVRYEMLPHDRQRFKKTIGLLGELGFAAGAREVYLPLQWLPSVKNMDELQTALARPTATSDYEVTAQHPLGTCRMGHDEETSVVNESGRVHGFDNLYVVDSSVVPTSIGVNPMLTVLAAADVIGRSLVTEKLAQAPARAPLREIPPSKASAHD